MEIEMDCVTILPLSYNGRGPGESCIQILLRFSPSGLRTQLVLPRTTKPLELKLKQSIGWPRRLLPWKYIRNCELDQRINVLTTLRDLNPQSTIVYFWPDVDRELLLGVRALGFRTVRECINNPLVAAVPILKRAYQLSNVSFSHSRLERIADDEKDEILMHDYVFSSNPEVDRSLLEIGVAPERILQTTFGWNRRRFDIEGRNTSGVEPIVLYVGTLNVRKGVVQLLQAWEQVGHGRLLLVGKVDPELSELVARAVAGGRILHINHTDNLSGLYSSATHFVFPTFEEGGPQVTYEAAAFGLPIITTPMGAARLVQDGVSGLVVKSGDTTALANALQSLLDNPVLSRRLGLEAQKRVAQFEYTEVGTHRANLLKEALAFKFANDLESIKSVS